MKEAIIKQLMVNLQKKKPFDSEYEALKMARFLNTKENVIHKMVAYKCSKCNKWHIGSNSTVLTDDIRSQQKEKLKSMQYNGKYANWLEAASSGAREMLVRIQSSRQN